MSKERILLLNAIRQKCLDCSAYSYTEVEHCEFEDCPLFQFRKSRRDNKIRGASKTALLRAIRKKCLDCCLGSPEEVRNCPVKNCPLYDFRFGKFPQ